MRGDGMLSRISIFGRSLLLAAGLGASVAGAGSAQAATPAGLAAPPEPPMPDRVRDTVDGWTQDAFSGCWSYTHAPLSAYRPIFRVTFEKDGSLLREPKLLDPPSTADERRQVDAVLAAFKRCDTFKLPQSVSRYYDQWKERVLYFGEIGTGVPAKDPLALVIHSLHDDEPTPSMPANVVDDFLRLHLARCRAYAGPGVGDYIPEIKVIFALDGSLAGPPTLLNPPADAKARRFAADALKAIAACPPVPPPIDFKTLPVRWRERILRLVPGSPESGPRDVH